MIHAICNTKGGVGKSLFSAHVLCCEAARLGREFDLYELDEKNISTSTFSKSEILANRGKTVRLASVADAIGEALYQSLSQKKEVIIDIGGGTDTDIVINALAQTREEIRYYVPTQSQASQLENIKQTFDLIENAGGVPNLVINFAKGWTADTSGAADIFGDKTLGITPATALLKRIKSIYFIQESTYFGHAERERELLGDFIKEGSIPIDKVKQELLQISATTAEKNGTTPMSEYAKSWGQFQEIKKAYDFYQHIAMQNILG